ncbi:MAG: antibiotic biosynthesis monooxygenase [Myxococcales bacterium]|nr:antibiotic biosynthesis monooxygenase [Myxococcales bacterium]
MFTVVFRSRLRNPDDAAYAAMAPRMLELVRTIPGFVSFKAFESADGERLALGHFESLEAVDAWRAHPEHREAQRLGQSRFYAAYDLEVCEVVRSHAFDGERRVSRTR